MTHYENQIHMLENSVISKQTHVETSSILPSRCVRCGPILKTKQILPEQYKQQKCASMRINYFYNHF